MKYHQKEYRELTLNKDLLSIQRPAKIEHITKVVHGSHTTFITHFCECKVLILTVFSDGNEMAQQISLENEESTYKDEVQTEVHILGNRVFVTHNMSCIIGFGPDLQTCCAP